MNGVRSISWRTSFGTGGGGGSWSRGSLSWPSRVGETAPSGCGSLASVDSSSSSVWSCSVGYK